MAKVLLLVVEDDLMLARMYADKLKSEGFEVDIAYDGFEGFEKMKLEKPSLVLMDIMMPNLDGLKTLEKAKKDPDIKDIPIIILTNLTGSSEMKQALREGATGYIVKSEFTPAEVVKKIKDTLASSGKHRADTAPKKQP